MAAITDYTSLSTAINDFTERDYAADDLDRFIGLAEGEFRLYLGPHYARETATAVLAFTAGTAGQPSGFIRPVSLLHTTYGALVQGPIAAIRQRRVWDASGIPQIYAVTGATIETGPAYTGDLTLDYEASLSGLSGSNATNWLISNAPQAYLSMCLSMEAAFTRDFNTAATLEGKSKQTLNDLGIQSMVAQYGSSRPVLRGATP